jgi:hypothetical protein
LTNIIPKKLTRVELIYQTAKLMERLHTWDNFMPRIQGYISGIKRKPRVVKGKIKFSIKTLYQTIRAISAVDKETRRSVFKIISYTKKHAPYLMSRVIGATLVNYMRYYISRSTREDLEDVIRIEKGLDINKYIDHSQVVVPKNFENSFKAIYLDNYPRVNSGLNDKSRTDEALVDVFTDFLTRWGKTFDQLSQQHTEFLHDLCDRTVNRLNMESEKQTTASNRPAGTMTMAKNRSSSEDILNIIEQKLRA